MKQKKVPLRKCVISQEKLPKKELIRVVRTPEGTVEIDLTGKLNGRGAYLARKEEVIQMAAKKRTLDHHLGVKTENALYEQLLELVKGEKQ